MPSLRNANHLKTTERIAGTETPELWAFDRFYDAHEYCMEQSRQPANEAILSLLNYTPSDHSRHPRPSAITLLHLDEGCKPDWDPSLIIVDIPAYNPWTSRPTPRITKREPAFYTTAPFVFNPLASPFTLSASVSATTSSTGRRSPAATSSILRGDAPAFTSSLSGYSSPATSHTYSSTLSWSHLDPSTGVFTPTPDFGSLVDEEDDQLDMQRLNEMLSFLTGAVWD